MPPESACADAATPARRRRKRQRAAEAAVWSGVLGGRYRPLNDAQARRVHATALDLLEAVGLASPTDSLVQTVTQAGGALG
ncbi:MAG: methyltransferase, partial [Gammaproteobacteria bacterium]|nr:methyltransferase [Gammaproteobacteria bacterium]